MKTKTVKVALELSEKQIDVLLSAIETATESYASPGLNVPRGEAWLDAMISEPPFGASFDLAQLAPIYRQIVKHWPHKGTRTTCHIDPEWQERWGARKLREQQRAAVREARRLGIQPAAALRAAIANSTRAAVLA